MKEKKNKIDSNEPLNAIDFVVAKCKHHFIWNCNVHTTTTTKNDDRSIACNFFFAFIHVLWFTLTIKQNKL